MEKKTLSTDIDVMDYEELAPQDRMLVDTAKGMTRNSYAPYSGFHVGAAILMDNGEIVRGSNQENAAFPSGTCAERSACFQASAIYPDVPMRKLAIAAWKEGEGFLKEPVSPCGACRQALLEYENRYGPIEVLLYGEAHIYRLPSVASLLPLCFSEF